MSSLKLLARAWKYRARLDPAEVRYVLKTVRPGQTAIDLGAHKGAYAYWLARAVGPQGKLIAIEPQPELAEALTAVMKPRKNVRVRWAAISDVDGEGKLSVRSAHGPSHGASLTGFPDGDAGRIIDVPTISLDGVAAADHLDSVDFIKCDVEGHEVAVFSGARAFLERYKPTVLCECELRHQHDPDADGPSSLDQLRAIFEGLGYRSMYFKDGALHPLDTFDPERDQTYGHGEYCNNFVFEP